MTPNLDIKPDIKVSLKQTFGIDSEMEVEAFSKKNIPKLEIPTGNPLLIKFKEDLKILGCNYLDEKRSRNLLVKY